MRRFLLGLLLTFTTGLALAADDAKWVDLTGDDLAKNWTTKGNWVLKDGVFTLTPRMGEKGWSRFNAYLWSNKTDYTDFECEFEYKVEKAGNSGFYFHVGDVANPVNKGIEVQIEDSFGQTKLTDHTSGGVIPGIAPTKNVAKAPGEWNKMIVTVKGDKLTVTLNGTVNNDIELSKFDKLKDRPKSGSIGFQDHGLPLTST
ncbi:hypothetical protein BH11PLA2_BH11PLA2_24750 [soil metagenome]